MKSNTKTQKKARNAVLAMEGGSTAGGRRIYTFEQFMAGEAPYVSVSGDLAVIPRYTEVSFPEVDQALQANLRRIGKRRVVYKVMDTGSAFSQLNGRGAVVGPKARYSHVDIARDTGRNEFDRVLDGGYHAKMLLCGGPPTPHGTAK